MSVTLSSQRAVKRKRRGDSRFVSLWKGTVSVTVTMLKVTAVAGVIGLFIGAANLVYTSAIDHQYFALTEVVVAGGERIDESAIRKLIGPVTAANIFAVDLADLGAAIEAHPWVESVSIRRELPGRLVVRIVERTAAARAKIGKHIWLIDAYGVLLERATPDREGLTLVEGLGIKGVETPGDQIDKQLLSPAFATMERLNEYRLFGVSPLMAVDISSRIGVICHFSGSSVTVTTPKKAWSDELARLKTVDYLLREKNDRVAGMNLLFADKVVVTYQQERRENLIVASNDHGQR